MAHVAGIAEEIGAVPGLDGETPRLNQE